MPILTATDSMNSYDPVITRFCSFGCIVNVDYITQRNGPSPSGSSDHQYQYYQITSLTMTSVMRTEQHGLFDECLTTIRGPDSLTPPLPISVDRTVTSSDLDDAVATSILQSLEMPSLCIASAKQVSLNFSMPKPTFKTSKIPTITPISLRSSSLIAAPLPTASPSNGAQRRVSWQTKVALGVVIPIVGLASTVVFTRWIWRKRRVVRGETQDRIASVADYTKPELDAIQRRHEMDGERERPELPADHGKHELAAVIQHDENTRSSRQNLQELRGSEPSHEMDTDCEVMKHVSMSNDSDAIQNQQVLSRDSSQCCDGAGST